MAFSFGNSGQNPFGSAESAAGNGSSQNGPDLEEIQTEGLGFLAISGEAKVQLLPQPWPSDNLPSPTSSLLSVASQKGLLAAAGPESVIIATTESLRKAYESPRNGEGQLRSFQPQLTLPMSMRISQVVFSSDEIYLILSAESGGGLAVYEVASLMNGNKDSEYQLSTNGAAVRGLIPNPTQEKGELLAVVTTDGKLMMANLKERKFVDGSNGPVLKEGVSCVSWSTRGKQLVAGMGDGTAVQITPEGVEKAVIPRPPNVDSNHHVSSISWLENHVFLAVHTPTQFDNSQAPMSAFHVVTRNPPANYMYQKISDPAAPFGLNRSPPHHFLLRLKDFPPNLQDLLVVASTASADIGLFSRSKAPLVSDKPADKITGVFTMTEMSDDSRRAQLPVTEDMSDTSPIGLAWDLSSRDKVLKPIPSDEMDESQSPLPGLMVLNNDGVLAYWWVVYNESIRQGVAYPGLVGNSSAQAAQTVSPQTGPAFGVPATQSMFGQSSFGKPSTQTPGFSGFSKPAAPAFGTPTINNGIGATTGSTFGSTGGLGKSVSPWGTAASGGASGGSAPSANSVFGSSNSNQGIAFGTSAFPGNKSSPWSSAAKPATPAFGQPGGMTAAKPSPFGSNSASNTFGSAVQSTPSSGGFASFATGGGFAAAASQNTTGTTSIFGSKPTSSVFATPSASSGMEMSTSFGGQESKSSQSQVTASGLFGGQTFNLGSTFKPDGSAKDDLPKAEGASSGSLFGTTFGNALSDAHPTVEETHSPEADMDADEAEPQPESKPKTETPEGPEKKTIAEAPLQANSTTPSATPAVSKFGMQTVTPVKSNLFGLPPAPTPPSAAVKPPGFSLGTPPFGTPASGKEDKATTPSTSKISNLFQTPAKALVPVIKDEPRSENAAKQVIQSIPEAPLPPDTTSKVSYAMGNSSSSSEADAPLPPDFITSGPKKIESPALPAVPEEPKQGAKPVPIPSELIPPSDVPGGPEDGEVEEDESDFGSDDEDQSDFEGSGEDITKDLSPSSESQQTPAFTPETSFKSGLARGDSSFLKVSVPLQGSTSRSLFGEITNSQAPVLPPPKPVASPRSPSPVRGALPGRLRPDSARSFSAPGAASQILSKKSAAGPSSTFTLSLEQKKAEERRLVESKARKEADEAQELVDEEDRSTQQYLQTPLVPTRHLDEFIAHQDYVGNADKNSIPAQVEAVYRDINSMIDTLGMNSRSLQCFIKGHSEGERDQPRSRDDLEDAEDWCLVEIENLESIISKDLTKELAHGRVKDVAAKVEACENLERDLARLRSKQEDLRTLLAMQSNQDQAAMVRSQPLTSEQAAQQHDLRKGFIKLQTLLSEAEESLTMLRAKVASQASSNGRSATGPTVEAVMKTIAKMTSMAEKRSGDVDVLETQMRKLRLNSMLSETRSREGSPFTTPLKRSSMHMPGSTSTHGAFYTPDSIRESPSRFRNSLASSVNSYARGSPARKKMSGFTEEDKFRLKANATQRQQVVDKLRSALQKSGSRMRLMDDDDIDGE